MRAQYLFAAFTASPAIATFVIQCTSRLLDERADPLVMPGQVASHAHVIAGGNGFDFEMDYAKARSSSCSTCLVKEDLSNYWTPKLYYQGQDGNFTAVPIEGDDSQGNMGGMAIYYLPRGGPDNDKLVPFPPGFRMFAGDDKKRVETMDFAGQAVRHRCTGETGEYTSLPPKVCSQGVRTQIVFPSCWDGVNLDSPDHKSHMSYPMDGNFDGGRCPPTHPVHFLTLFFEVTYRTDQFQWYSDKQPFVLSNGDPTGYSYHGDFISGWDVPKLAEAIAKCPDGSTACDPNGGVFTYFTLDERQACKLPSRVPEQIGGVLEQLPGCNPVTLNPVNMESCPRDPKLQSAADAGFTDLTTTKGWKYLGCGVDDPVAWGSRALVGAQQNIAAMTIGKCIDACSAAGYTYTGLEYSSECYCGNTLNPLAVPKPGILGNCNMKCAGDPLSNCGGGKAITLYQKCATGECTNTGSTPGGSIDPPAGSPSPISPTNTTIVAPVKAPTSSSSATQSSSVGIAPVKAPYPISNTTSSSINIVAPVKAPATTTTSTSSTSLPDPCDDEPVEPPTCDDGPDEPTKTDAAPTETTAIDAPVTGKSSSSASPTYNDALTGSPTQSTFSTVKKPSITSPVAHTRVRTTVYTSVVTETYWAR